MPFEIILIASIVIFLNVMDSVTTEIGFRQYPDKELKSESNPLMRRLMLKSRLWSEIVKHCVIPIAIGVCIFYRDLFTLKCFFIILSLVVINNSYIIASRHITKRKIRSPFLMFIKRIHLPDKAVFPTFLIIALGIAYLIVNFIWN